MSIDSMYRTPGTGSKRIVVIVFLAVLIGLAVANGRLTAAAGTAPSSAMSQPPVIDLNGPDIPGLDYATTFVEDEGSVPIVSGSLTVSADSTHLTSATISLAANPDKSQERIDITTDLSELNITKEYSASKGILKLSGRDTVENYLSVLLSVSYNNESQAPDTTDREITFIISDGTSKSTPAKSIVPILAVNDAPILDNSGDMSLDPIAEDDRSQVGNYVATIIQSAEQSGIDRITDPDDLQGIDPEGIAVIEVGDSNGTWQFSLDAGTTWSDFGTVNNSSAVLLDESARIRFLPDANYSGIAGFIFRAWDQTTEAGSGERADASISGGASAFSVDTESVTVSVSAVNDPPVVDLNGMLPGVNYAATFLSRNAPIAASSLDAFIRDEEGADIVSLVITLVNRPDGPLESIVVRESRSGIKVTPYDPVTGTIRFDGPGTGADYSALLNSVGYLNTSATIGSEARVLEFTVSDGVEASMLARTTLTPVQANVAPILNAAATMTLSDIAEDDDNPAGSNVAEILASAQVEPISDADGPGALRGFAIVGAENLNGDWQFSVDAGQSWLPVGQVSATAALLLDEEARLRFLPDPDFSGSSRSFIFRAWDQSEGSNGAGGVDTSTNGGATPFSSGTDTVAVFIQPINDAPRLDLDEETRAEFVEGNGPVVVAGSGLSVADVDNDTLVSAIVIIKNRPENAQDVLSATTNGSGIAASFDQASATLRLTGSASVADYQAALRSVTFDNRSRDPDVTDRVIGFTVNDGDGSSNEAMSTVSLMAVNDLPVIDLNGETAAGVNNDVYFDRDGVENGGMVQLASALQIQDADNTSLIGATIHLVDGPDEPREALNVDVSGTNIAASYSEDGQRIVLNGQDSLAAYQSVMRTAVYFNRSTYANRAIRTVIFSVEDASSGIAQSAARVIILPQYAHFPFVAQNLTGEQPVEEPNNTCLEATPIIVNLDYEFDASDVNDWFRFTLGQASQVNVELVEFAPEDGQLLVAKGNCGELKLLGQNGDFSSRKIVKLGTLEPGRYYIWLINDGRTDLGKPYKLRVAAE